jgi:hypothetical protein
MNFVNLFDTSYKIYQKNNARMDNDIEYLGQSQIVQVGAAEL